MAADIRARIRQKFADGVLPQKLPRKAWLGYGSGRACSGCEDSILPAQSEYAFAGPRTGGKCRFHVGCYALWVSSVRRAELQRAQSRQDRARGRSPSPSDTPPATQAPS
jgi:hypothetical protein